MAAEGGGSGTDLTGRPEGDAESRTPPTGEPGPATAAPGSSPLLPAEAWAGHKGVAGDLRDSPYNFTFVQAVRLLHLIAKGKEPLGYGGPPSEEPVRFRTDVSLSFPPSTVSDLTLPSWGETVPILTQPFFGLAGPSGVLPRHYTELLIRLQRDTRGAERTALRDWFDVFNHRLVSIFYRAFEKYRPVFAFEHGEHDRDQPDAYTQTFLSLIGLGLPPLRNRLHVSGPSVGSTQGSRSGQRVWSRQRRPDHVLAHVEDLAAIYYSGYLAHRPRNAVSLEALLADYLGLPTKVQQFRGQWLALEPENVSRLSGDPNARLGVSAVAGEKVWNVESKILVRLGPLDYSRFLDLLPDPSPTTERKSFFVLSLLIRLYVGLELDVDVQLLLKAPEVPETRLATADETTGPGSRLGWNSWLLSLPSERDAGDAVFPAEAVTTLEGAMTAH